MPVSESIFFENDRFAVFELP